MADAVSSSANRDTERSSPRARDEHLNVLPKDARSTHQPAPKGAQSSAHSTEQLHVLSLAVEQSPASVVITDAAGQIEYVNAKFTEVTGYSLEEVLGKDPSVLKSGEMLAEGYRQLWKTITRGEQWRGEFHNRKKNGEFYWESALISPVLDESRQIKHFVAIKEDITRRKAAEDALRTSEERCRAILEAVEVGIALIDRDHNIVACNRELAEMVDLPPGELIGQKCYREFAALDEVCCNCPGARALKEGVSAEAEIAGRSRSGRTYNVRLRASPVFDADGKTVGFVEVVQDIQPIKEQQKALFEAKLAAEAASRAKSEFLANMSHEIRTPMTAILGYSDMLQSPQLSPNERHEYVEGIQRNGNMLLQLINDILDLSKIEAGKLSVESIACYPRQVVEDVRAMLAERAARKGIDLRIACEASVPNTTMTDPVRLRQILINLVGNAVKFTERGHISIDVCCKEDQGRPQLAFVVEDTGIGIPADKLAILFTPFSQGDASMTRRFGGTGLGLALARRLAVALGGDIRVSSEEGRGSTFTLTIAALPASEAARDCLPVAEPRRETAATPEDRPFTGRLLLVEDAPEIQRVMQHHFRQLKVEADVAENGETGCQKAAQSLQEGRPYDLILMDVQMPVLNGLEATRRLRDQGWTGPIVALTAHALTEDRDRCFAAGCTDFVTKPLSKATLQTIVRRYCSGVTEKGESFAFCTRSG